MANRIPLIVDPTAGQIQELPLGDNLDIGGGEIVNVSGIGFNDLTISGNLNAAGNIIGDIVTANTELSTTGLLTAGTVGNLIPDANVTYYLGNSTNQWKELWVSNNTIYINSIPVSIGDNNYLTVNGANVVTADSAGVTNLTSITATGNINANNLNAVNTVNANAYIGNFITVNNTLTAAHFSGEAGNLSNVTWANINGANAGIAANLAAFGANPISTTGTVTAGNLAGNGAQITSIDWNNITGANSNVAAYLATNNTSNVTTTANVNANNVQVNSVISLANGLSFTGNTIASNYNIVIDPVSNAGGVSGTVTVLGNLSVTGNLSYVDVESAVTSNLRWVAADNANTAASASGGGLAVGPDATPYATWLYNSTSNTWVSNIAIAATGGANIGGALTGATTGSFSSSITAGSISSVGDITTSNAVTAGSFSTTGTITGSQLVGNGIGITYINAANIVGPIGNGTTNLTGDSITGNAINATVSISSAGSITAAHIVGEGGNISNIQWSNVTGGNAGIVANLASLGGNPVSTTGAVTAGYFVGDGGNISNINSSNIVGAYSNSNVAVFLGNLGANSVSTTGSVTAAHLVGEGSNISNITAASITGQVANALVSGTVYESTQSNITQVGTLVSLSVSGGITAGQIGGNGNTISNIQWGNITGANTGIVANLAALGGNPVSTTGTITAGHLVGEGGNISNITAASITGQVANALVSGTVYTNAQPNITSVGILTALSVSGTVTAANLVGEAGNLSNIQWANISGTPTLYSNANAASFLVALGANSISTTGSVTAANLLGEGGNISNIQWSNVTGANSGIAAYLASGSDSSNITTTAYVNAGNVSVTSNVVLNNGLTLTANNIISNYDIVIDPASNAAGVSGNVSILGNLSVAGNLAYVDVTTATTGNLLWIAADDATTAAGASGGGLSVGPNSAPYATWTYNSTSNTWVSNIAITATGGANIGGALTGATTGSFSGSVTAANLIGEGSNISNIKGANITGEVALANTVTNNSQPNITSVGTLTALSVSGNITPGAINTTGNISGSYFIGNGAALTGLPESYTNANSAAFLANLGSNTVSTTGAITAAYFVGDGANLTGVTSYTDANAASFLASMGANNISTTGSITAAHLVGEGGNISNITAASITGQVANALVSGTVYSNLQPNITSVGTLSSLSVSGVATIGNIAGEGGNISNIAAGNITGQVANALVAGTVYTNAQPNITSVGILSALNVTGIISTAGNIKGEGGNISNITGANVTGEVAVANTVSNPIQSNITLLGTLSALNTSGAISAAGNITGAAIYGNGAPLTTITGANVTGNVPSATIANTVTNPLQPNITSVGTLTSVTTSGGITATGNISGNVFIGNGAGLGSLTGANVTGEVALANTVTNNAQPNITSVGTLSALAVANNISANNLSIGNNVTVGGNLSVTGNINLSGNVTQISGNSGQFFGDANGFGALYAGVTSYTVIPQTVIQASANFNEYAEINIENTNSGPKATSDYIATADTGTNSTYYVDLGITSSTWDGSSANNIGTVIKALDSYLYAQGGGAGNIGGNLVLAAPTAGKSIKVVVGGGTDSNIVAQFSNTGVVVTGTVSATGNVAGGNVTTAGSVTATGNVAGGNVTTAGSVTATGNVAGGNVSAVGTLITEAGFVLNPIVIANSYSIPSGYNASTAGPITLAANVVITVPTGSNWSIV